MNNLILKSALATFFLSLSACSHWDSSSKSRNPSSADELCETNEEYVAFLSKPIRVGDKVVFNESKHLKGSLSGPKTHEIIVYMGQDSYGIMGKRVSLAIITPIGTEMIIPAGTELEVAAINDREVTVTSTSNKRYKLQCYKSASGTVIGSIPVSCEYRHFFNSSEHSIFSLSPRDGHPPPKVCGKLKPTEIKYKDGTIKKLEEIEI